MEKICYFYWSKHAITELLNDDLTRPEVENAFLTCEAIEDYPTQHRPLPDCLVLGMLGYSDPLHAVVAIDEVKEEKCNCGFFYYQNFQIPI